jgi:glycerate dehydrogenase
MNQRPRAAFLDFATLGPGIDTAALDALADVAYYSHTPPAKMLERLDGINVAIVNKARIDADAIKASPALKLIVLAATGSDNVDLKEARARGVGVANIRDYCTAAVVQHVFAMVLSLTRRLSGYQAAIHTGAWQRSDTFALFEYPIRELTGKAAAWRRSGAVSGWKCWSARAPEPKRRWRTGCRSKNCYVGRTC